ncbi:MAG: hypothetical protein BAJATHORv1_40017 [Candidatus Thorarchaeota archaeon]|nr:MAG: hypothetical protein BAJATHORv1_40017 [Candidatus Thorarchaeota archaeon]
MTDEKETSEKDNEITIEEVQDRLDEISERLARVERLMEKMGPGIEEVSESAKVIREGFEFYDGMVRLMSKFTKVQRLESRFQELKKDDISWNIVKILDESRPLNISQITAAVRAERGTASRRIIRERIKILLRKRIVKSIEGEDDRAMYYTLVKED